MKIFVLAKLKTQLMPCHSARVKSLLKKGKAVVYRMYACTVILKDRAEKKKQPVKFKLDPGSKTTGIA